MKPSRLIIMVNLPITREEAVVLLKSMDQQTSDMNHYLEAEAIMRALAKRFGEDVDYWGMLGLLHDVDWALTKNDVKEHCIKAVELLKRNGFDEKFIQIVQSHGYGYDIIPALKDKQRTGRVEHALIAAETLTGLILRLRSDEGQKNQRHGGQRTKKEIQGQELRGELQPGEHRRDRKDRDNPGRIF